MPPADVPPADVTPLRRDPAAPDLLLRVAVFTAATVCLGVAAHVTGGGRLPAAGPLALVSAAVAVLSTALGQGRCRLPALLAGVGLVQVAMHVAFLQADPGVPEGRPAWQFGPVGHVHADLPLPLASHGGGAEMTLAHAVAALLLACWLARGEAALWRAARRVVRALLAPAAPLVRLQGRRHVVPPSGWASGSAAGRSPCPVGVRGPPRGH